MAAGAYLVLQNISGAILQTLIAGLAAGLIYLISTFFLKSPESESIFRKFFYGRHPPTTQN